MSAQLAANTRWARSDTQTRKRTTQPGRDAATAAERAPVADNIRAEMARRHMSQTVVANLLGLSTQAVSRRLCGETPFRITEIQQIAELLGVDVTELFAAAKRKGSRDADAAKSSAEPEQQKATAEREQKIRIRKYQASSEVRALRQLSRTAATMARQLRELAKTIESRQLYTKED
jgi:transcriptional regulator with XRE-family HTH domain